MPPAEKSNQEEASQDQVKFLVLSSGRMVVTNSGFDEASAERADYEGQMNDLAELVALAGEELARLNRKYQRRYPFKPVDDNEQFVEDNRGYFKGVARAAAKKAKAQAELRKALPKLTPEQIDNLSAAVA